MTIKCITVDDEPLAHVVLEKYISQVQSLQLVAKCKNAMEAINFLHANSVDLIFLDINMPDLSGIEMLKTLKQQPKIIFTTAYSEFALESYEYGVSDYLLKPIKFDRFLAAVNKVIDLLQLTTHKIEKKSEIQLSETEKETAKNDFIFIKQDHSIFKVQFSNILYVEAYGNYVQIYTTDKKIVARKTMTEMDKSLTDQNLIRIHKSFIVNVLKIEEIKNNQIRIADKEISIGTIYKRELMKKMNL